ncbi:MAG: PEGA domain-containing protein, partial [Cyanobacteria bacterium]|nr:PEGA domain-containing protein [Cyanobacteriota bacterium]
GAAVATGFTIAAPALAGAAAAIAAAEQEAAAARRARAEADEARSAPAAAEEDPIAAQIASYKPKVEQPAEPEPVQAYEEPPVAEPVQAYEAPAQETPAYEEAAPAPSYAQEAQPAPASYAASDEPERKSKMPMMAMAAVIVLLLGAVGWFATRGGGDGGDGGGLRAGEGELAVQSRPPGARVLVDGKEVGVTPATVRLPAGPHVLEVQVGKLEPRIIPLTISAGVQTAHTIEFQEANVTGSLSIRSEPSGARITIDGLPRGTTPATIPNLSAGTHTVGLELGGRKATQTVKIDPGSTAQLVVPMPRR